MKLKIKVKPDDFTVEEIASLPLAQKGDFSVYLLKKNGWNTVELIYQLARKLNIPFSCFSYGGKKDRHALTAQYIAIKSPNRLELEEKNYSLKFIGLMRRPMGPDLISGNKFEITVRNLKPQGLETAQSELTAVNSSGYPNYFDDQRFGSFAPGQSFLAEKLLKRQFNGALKIYLTSTYPKDKPEDKKRKKLFFLNWKDWPACLEKAEKKVEKDAFAYLNQTPQGFLYLLKQIPREEISLFFSAYQSYLWNRMLTLLIQRINPCGCKTYPGRAGEYIFPSSPDNSDYLNNLILPAPGTKAQMPDNLSRDIYNQVLESNGIKQPMFNSLKVRTALFKSFPRKVWVKPENLKSEVLDDELYNAKKKFKLSFFLPRGSYATMLIKRIFS